MKALSKGQKVELKYIIDTLIERSISLEKAIKSYNYNLKVLNENLMEEVNNYNEAVEEFESFRDGVISEIDDYVSEKSERWVESEAGTSIVEWKEAIEQVAADEVMSLDLELMMELSVELPDWGEICMEFPQSPDEV